VTFNDKDQARICTATREMSGGGCPVLIGKWVEESEVRGGGTCLPRESRALHWEGGSGIFWAHMNFSSVGKLFDIRTVDNAVAGMAEKETKKRKRLSNGVETPNKKVALATPTEKDLVKVTFDDGAGLHPVLVSSPGLNLPRIQFNAYTKPRSSRSSNDGQPTPNTHSILLHSSEHPRLDYTATPNTLDQELSHYVAIFDPTTNELQITSAYHLNLRTTLRSETTEQQKHPRRPIGQQREELGREFGTKKAKRALDDRTTNAIVGRGSDNKQKTTNDVQSAILDSMSAPGGAAAMREDEALEAALASKPIPKPNLAAATVEEVYPLNTLMPPQDAKLVSIKEWEENAKADIEMTLTHRYPGNRVEALGKREDILRLKALGYLNLLLDFHAALTSLGKTGKKVPRKEVMDRKLATWPEALVSSVRKRFANGANELPKWHLERLYTHICALALYIDGYVTDTRDLREDLKLEQKELMQYFRELGCKVAPPTEKEREQRKLKKVEASMVKIAKLKLPLDFPKVRSGRKR
jgi:DNA-directed RNA polymerase I subunit RPA49